MGLSRSNYWSPVDSTGGCLRTAGLVIQESTPAGHAPIEPGRAVWPSVDRRASRNWYKTAPLHTIIAGRGVDWGLSPPTRWRRSMALGRQPRMRLPGRGDDGQFGPVAGLCPGSLPSE